MPKKIANKNSIIFFLIIAIIFGFSGNKARADYRPVFSKYTEKTAVLYMEGNNEMTDGKVHIKIMADPGSQSMNALSFRLNFSPDRLRLDAISIDDSLCSFFIENDFNNTDGDINITCGRSYPGTNQIGEVAELIFTPNAAGYGELNFADASVLGCDGYGTNILIDAKDKMIDLN
jgi:hypothetical protein